MAMKKPHARNRKRADDLAMKDVHNLYLRYAKYAKSDEETQDILARELKGKSLTKLFLAWKEE
ncbi:MAG: hypothetical protein HY261_10535 [Chloroflexi bacterium]|nr:hypothetical protein [Chloroflexota bacterium]